MRLWVLLVLLAGVAHAQPRSLRKEPLGFSHAIHTSDVDKAGKPAVACTRCHGPKGTGRPSHASCFGECHAATFGKDPVPVDRLLLCNSCHAEAALVATPRPKLTVPFPIAPDLVSAFGHKAHAATGCAQCHGGKPAPHKRCIGCHDGGKSFAMSDCVHCHAPATTPVRLAPAQILVRTAFSHAKHAPRAKQCIACHPGITDTDARELPRPTVETCSPRACHDGAAAFGVTVACTRCHKDVPPGKLAVPRPEKRFSHTQHEQTKLPCSACHLLGKTGETTVAGHAACIGCHAKDFGAKAPATCGACHSSTEPWRPLVADNQPPDRSEFGATLSHDKHPQPCTTCHGLTTNTIELRPARGHASCSKAGCHAVTGGPAPQLATCDGCHQHGIVEARERARLSASWSVRAAFSHLPHRTDRGKELACTSCHTDMSSPTTLSLSTPAKATCARCHDGSVAFKLTGTSCFRCHRGANP